MQAVSSLSAIYSTAPLYVAYQLVGLTTLDSANKAVSNGHRLQRTPSNPLFLPWIISLFIMCIEII